MTYNYKPIVDIFTDIVTDVRAKYNVTDGDAPYYLYGHPVEIVNILSKKTNNSTLKFKKFPLIVLFMDFAEDVQPEGRNVSLRLAIVTDTKPTFYTADRYTNTFKTVLYPIWELLHQAILDSNYIDSVSLAYAKTDRPYWGRQGLYGNEGNIFNDFVDAIEIDNLEITINENC